MKLVKEISTNEYKIISNTGYTSNQELYINRADSPIYWENFGIDLSDILLAKDIIKNLYTINGWNYFKDNEEKKTVARILSYSLLQSELDEVLNIKEQNEAKLNYIRKVKEARENRWEYLRIRLALEVTEYEALCFYTDTKNFKGDYIDAGLPHLIMWLTSGIYTPLGIDYTTTGFKSKPYFTQTMLQMCIDYLIDGIQYITL